LCQRLAGQPAGEISEPGEVEIERAHFLDHGASRAVPGDRPWQHDG
jgi:hypothetical protein